MRAYGLGFRYNVSATSKKPHASVRFPRFVFQDKLVKFENYRVSGVRSQLLLIFPSSAMDAMHDMIVIMPCIAWSLWSRSLRNFVCGVGFRLGAAACFQVLSARVLLVAFLHVPG